MRLPSKRYKNIEIRSAHGDVWLPIKSCVSAGWANGYFARHVSDYPSRPIRIMNHAGGIDAEHSGNGAAHLNTSDKSSYKEK